MDILIAILIMVIYAAGFTIFVAWVDLIIEHLTGEGIIERIGNIFKKK